jgi:ligand-binding sensor domain-containing protein
MMRVLLYISGFIFCLSAANGQGPVGSWSDHLKYSSAVNLAASPEKIYASTGEALIIYNKDFSELTKMSTVNGLTESGISGISWSDENGLLVVAYKSANIDLITNNTIFNIPDIMYGQIGSIAINRIRTNGRHAYLASDHGIIVIDLIKKEIRDTWKPGRDSDGNIIFDVAFGQELVYAATNHGVLYGELSNTGLSYFGNWEQLTGLPDSRSNLLIFSDDKLYANFPMQISEGDEVYTAGTNAGLFSKITGVQNTSFDLFQGGFTISSNRMARIYDSQGSLEKTIVSYGWGTPDICQAIIEEGNIWIADKTQGLIKGKNLTDFIKFEIPGPASDNVAHIKSFNGKTVICGGGTDSSWDGIGRPFQVSIHSSGKFVNLISENEKDAMRCCFDPSDDNHFFISSWGNGLFEYRNNVKLNHYESGNSPLGEGSGKNMDTRICGITFDTDGNLWVTQGSSLSTIKVLKPDGKWIIFPHTVNTSVPLDLISLSDGQKWIMQPGANSLFILDDNDTPELLSDDSYMRLSVRDSEGNFFSVFSLTEDLDGNIWVGTDKGPLVYFNPGKLFDKGLTAHRIKIPRNDGSGLADYLLGTETITSIAVDGDNRKWIGTSGSGAYLLSSDGSRVIKAYNKGNSPVFSDSIATVSVDNRTGEVWFGTSRGTLSIRESATSGGEKFSGVYSFPNPVRDDFLGNVTITGLLRDTNVKITDVSGNLVFETTSTGGQASWDLKTYNGIRVTTGVYLVFCASADGSQSCMTKILVISR